MNDEKKEPHVSIPNALIHNTIRILVPKGKDATVGTGFVVGFPSSSGEDGVTIPCVVTNRHVVRGAAEGHFTLSTANEKGDGAEYGKQLEVKILDFEKQWIGHPDENIDLTVFPFNPLLEDTGRRTGAKIYTQHIGFDLVADQETLETIEPTEEIIMLGYPRGIWDRENNLPVVRRGIVSTPPALPWNGHPSFLIDCAAYHGSSGSPVFRFSRGSYYDATSNTVKIGQRLNLIGIQHAVPNEFSEGQIEEVTIADESEAKLVSKSFLYTNLGLCHPATKLNEFVPLLQDLEKKVPGATG